MDLEQIRQHWEEAGKKISSSSTISPTSRDPFLGKLEEAYILQYLRPEYKAVEMGCGDASHTLEYARKVESIKGIDISESLIQHARQRAEFKGENSVEFMVGSVLDVEHLVEKESVDCVISQRCLINLPSWEAQEEALEKIYHLLVPGGRFLITEGFQDELDALNSLRGSLGLSEIHVAAYNRNFRHDEFDAFIHSRFVVEAVHDYGLYLMLSRVYHPLVVSPEDPKHDSRLNEVAYMLSRGLPRAGLEKYSYNLLYVLRKK